MHLKLQLLLSQVQELRAYFTWKFLSWAGSTRAENSSCLHACQAWRLRRLVESHGNNELLVWWVSPEELAGLSTAISSCGNVMRTTQKARADRSTGSLQWILSNLPKEAYVSSSAFSIAKCSCKMLACFDKIFRFRQLHGNTTALILGRMRHTFTWKISSRDECQLSFLDWVETQPGLWCHPKLSCKRSMYFLYTPSWTQPEMRRSVYCVLCTSTIFMHSHTQSCPWPSKRPFSWLAIPLYVCTQLIVWDFYGISVQL